MSTFLFPGFESLSEFINGLHGDCGPLALLLCLHVIDPKRWPLSKAGLAALVANMQMHGCLMRSDGESNIPGLDKYLNVLRVPHVTVGYGAFTLDGLHAQLKMLATTDPRLVLAEWSAAGKGLHDDEANVAYHYSAFGGIDTARGYYRGDGDSSTDDRSGKSTAPILTGWPDIEAAKPIGYIVIDVPAGLKPHPAPAPTPAVKPKPSAPTPAPAPTPHPVPVPAQPVAPSASPDGILNLIKLFKAAAAYVSLTPAQRAVLRLVEGIIAAVLVTVAPAISDALAGRAVNWGNVVHTALATFAVAAVMAGIKWAKAHLDPAL